MRTLHRLVPRRHRHHRGSRRHQVATATSAARTPRELAHDGRLDGRVHRGSCAACGTCLRKPQSSSPAVPATSRSTPATCSSPRAKRRRRFYLSAPRTRRASRCTRPGGGPLVIETVGPGGTSVGPGCSRPTGGTSTPARSSPVGAIADRRRLPEGQGGGATRIRLPAHSAVSRQCCSNACSDPDSGFSTSTAMTDGQLSRPSAWARRTCTAPLTPFVPWRYCVGRATRRDERRRHPSSSRRSDHPVATSTATASSTCSPRSASARSPSP